MNHNEVNKPIFKLANTIFKLAGRDNITDITQIKLQKISFIIYGVLLAKLNVDVLDGEMFYAWKYGPINTILWDALNYKKSSNISANDIRYNNADNIITDKDIMGIINLVWSFFKDFSPFDLVAETHKFNSPWDLTAKENKNGAISKDLVKTYYQKYLQEGSEKLIIDNTEEAKKTLKMFNLFSSYKETINYLSTT